MFNALRYLRDHRIPYWTEGKNVSYGNVNIRCPLCRDHSNHGSFFPDGSYRCWLCGGHQVEDVVTALERIPYHEACRVVIDYDDGIAWRPPGGLKKKAAQGLTGNLTWPPGTMPLQEPHKRYLAGRGFDPAYLETKYGLKGTGPAGPYAWRVIAPIIYNGQMVSYQGRDITGQAEIKYKACYPDLELISHKEILYNADNAGRIGIIVEGMYDVWRLGDGVVAAIGTTVTKAQARMAATRFEKVFILFDSEPSAQKKAWKLAGEISVFGTETDVIGLEKGDPADLSNEEAARLKKSFLK